MDLQNLLKKGGYSLEHKKKYPGGLKVLLLPLFIILLGMFSTCYANVSEEYVNYSIDLLRDNYTNSNTSYQNNFRTYLNNLTNEQRFYIYNTINNYLTANNLSDITDYNIIFIARYSNTSPSYRFDVVIFNNTAPNGYENLGFYLWGSTKVTIYKDNSSTNNFYHIRFNIQDITQNNFYTYSTNSSSNYLNGQFGYYEFNSDYSVLTLKNIACCGLPGGYCYLPFNTTSSTIPVILKDVNGNFNPIISEPESSGDIPIDSGNTGTITNNSGETTGQVDLSGIQNGLGNINNSINQQGQAIIDNQNQNTQSIIDNQNNNTNQITETLTEQPNLSNTTISSGDIERCFRF